MDTADERASQGRSPLQGSRTVSHNSSAEHTERRSLGGRGSCGRPFPFALEFVEPRDDD